MSGDSDRGKKIVSDFGVTIDQMRRIIDDFHIEMERGLSGKRSSLKMVPSYTSRPSGDETGDFLAIDLGGTNFRILRIALPGRRRPPKISSARFTLTNDLITGPARRLFDFIARSVENFISSHHVDGAMVRGLGFTFSFPLDQRAIDSGTLVSWTKGFNVSGVIGKDVVRLLSEAFLRRRLNDIKISALINDTVGTLAARSYVDPSCDMGIIIGTGTNACYPERLKNIKKLKHITGSSGEMIVNIEWGGFDGLKTTTYDRALDKVSRNPGEQRLEKMVSGLYIGEIVRRAISEMVRGGLIFRGSRNNIFDHPYSFRAEDVGVVESDDSSSLLKISRLLDGLGSRGTTVEDRALFKKVSSAISERAARISAAAIAAVITRMDPGLARSHVLAVDGSVYLKNPVFRNNIRKALKEIFGKKAFRIKALASTDGSGSGAAIVAASRVANIP